MREELFIVFVMKPLTKKASFSL